MLILNTSRYKHEGTGGKVISSFHIRIFLQITIILLEFIVYSHYISDTSGNS